MADPDGDSMPPYAFVPGGPYPHPTGSPLGHLAGRTAVHPPAIEDDNWASSPDYLRGFELFNEGFYWEAHEIWEGLWHAHGRLGPIADVLKGLIKLAAAGVKVRQKQPHGVETHARRAAEAFRRASVGRVHRLLGFDLDVLERLAERVAETIPAKEAEVSERVVSVFDFALRPSLE